MLGYLFLPLFSGCCESWAVYSSRQESALISSYSLLKPTSWNRNIWVRFSSGQFLWEPTHNFLLIFVFQQKLLFLICLNEQKSRSAYLVKVHIVFLGFFPVSQDTEPTANDSQGQKFAFYSALGVSVPSRKWKRIWSFHFTPLSLCVTQLLHFLDSKLFSWTSQGSFDRVSWAS